MRGRFFLAGVLVAAVASATDVDFTGTAHPNCFAEGAEGAVTVKATNTLGHTTDAIVMAACAAFEASAERPTWIVEKTFQSSTDPLKLPTVFTYEFNNQNCIRADPAGPGGEWPAGTTETVTFTYRVPETVNATTLVIHDTAWSQEAPKDQEIRLQECPAPPKKPLLSIKKYRNLSFPSLLGYSLKITNEGDAPSAGDITIEDAIPKKLKIKDAHFYLGKMSWSADKTPITPLGQTVKVRYTGSLQPKQELWVDIWVEPKPDAAGETRNTAFVCGGGDPTAPCSDPRQSNEIVVQLPTPIGPVPTASITGPATAKAGTPVSYAAAGSNLALSAAPASTVAYAWVLSDVALVPAAVGPSLTHTFAKPGNQTVSLIAFANGTRSTNELLVNVASAAPGCAANDTTLCLLGDRFEVQVDWQALNNSTNGVGTARPITSDTGAFWFFSPANLELIVKVLDGRALNGKFWVFYGALSDVQYEIKVTDTQTGQVRQYVNRQGDLASVAHTSAFPIAAGASAGEQGVVADDVSHSEPLAFAAEEEFSGFALPAGTCVADSNTKQLCLSDRFDVSVTCSAPGTACTPTPVKLTTDTGYFWFFNGGNIELVAKVVDGRGLNGKFWFFYGALSDVQYTIRLTDRVTGKFKDYVNLKGNLASVADTSAITP